MTMMTYEEFNDLCQFNTDKYLWLREEIMDVGGGKISIADIDQISQYENTDKVMISGLRQDTFEYFIEKYGYKLKYIKFFKNKLVEDLSALSGLAEVRYIEFFHNQRVTKLWDMSANRQLEGLCLNDFTRLHSLDGAQTAPNLKHLLFGDKVWNSSVLTDLTPLIGTKLVSFAFGGKTIENKDISVYEKMPELLHLDFPTNFYTTEEITQIMAKCPRVSGYALRPYIKFDRNEHTTKDVLICGTGKPFLDSQKDKTKIQKYTDTFNTLVEYHKAQR
jgi:hypothetical protein